VIGLTNVGEIHFMGLIDEITAVSGKYRAQTSDVGQLLPNVQNFGLKAGQRAFRHKAGS
jgi:hypothetical protein